MTITDNGNGVPTSLREKIFEQFYTAKAAGKYAGLGLALSAKIVQEHEGNMRDTEDKQLGGDRFEVCLPLSTVSSANDDQAA